MLALRGETGVAATAQDRFVDDGVAGRIGDESFGAQIAHRHDRFHREPVVGRDGEHQRLGLDDVQVEVAAGDRRAQHADVECAVAQLFALLAGEQVGVHLEFDLGQPVLQRAGHLRQVRQGGGTGEADPGEPAAAVGDAPGSARARLDCLQDPLGLGQEEPAGRGDLHLPRRAAQQRDAELVLQLPDRVRKRGLGEVQAFGGAAEVAGLGDGGEVPQVAQFHRAASSPAPRVVSLTVSSGIE